MAYQAQWLMNDEGPSTYYQPTFTPSVYSQAAGAPSSQAAPAYSEISAQQLLDAIMYLRWVLAAVIGGSVLLAVLLTLLIVRLSN